MKKFALGLGAFCVAISMSSCAEQDEKGDGMDVDERNEYHDDHRGGRCYHSKTEVPSVSSDTPRKEVAEKKQPDRPKMSPDDHTATKKKTAVHKTPQKKPSDPV